MTKDERLQKYPTSYFDPKPDCIHCKGTGERYIEKLNIITCCICIYVDHKFCEQIAIELGNRAKEILKRG